MSTGTRTPVEQAVAARATLGEGPTWDPETGRLIWVDILDCRVHTYEPASGRTTVRATEQHVGAAKPRTGGGLVVNLRDGVGLYGPEETGGAFSWLAHDPVPGRRGNDAAVAPDGTLWAGTMHYDEKPGGGGLTRFAGDGTATEVFGDVTVSNGTGWSPDGSLLYYVDTPTRRIDVCRMADGPGGHGGPGGLPVDRRPFARIEDGAGLPDGLTVDAEGCVWVALWDGSAIRRYTPRGDLDRTLTLPVRRPTACAFGGPGLRDLYVTSARTGLDHPHPLSGALLVVPDAGQGVRGTAFAG